MNDNKIVIKLSGNIPADEYRKAVEHFVGLVNALTETVAGTETIEWQLSDLHYGSAVMGFAGFSTNQSAVREVVAAYGVATRAVARHEPIPYPTPVRVQLEALTGLINGHITAIEFRTSTMESIIETPLPKSPTEERPNKWVALGSVRGKVQTISERTSLYFSLYDTIFDDAVRCSMKHEQQEMMRGIWGKEVVVTGTVTRHPSTGQPIAIHDILDIEEIHSAPLNSYRRARGILEFNPNEDSSEERVRRLRDAESLSPRLLYWDSCVFIDYLEKNPSRIAELDEVWTELETRPGSKIYTSQVTTVEVAYIGGEKKQGKLSLDVIEQLDALWFNHPLVEIVEVNRKIANLARELVRHNIPNQWGLTTADAIHLASAQFLRQPRNVQECHTYDSKLEKYGHLIGLIVCKPYAQKPRLPLDSEHA